MTKTAESPEEGAHRPHSEPRPVGTALTRVGVLLGPVETMSNTYIRGGSAGSMGPMHGTERISISGSTTQMHHTFVPPPEQPQALLDLPVDLMPMARGHWMAIVWASRKGARFRPLFVRAKNQDTGHETELRGPDRSKDKARVTVEVEALVPYRFWRTLLRSGLTCSVILGGLLVLAQFAASNDPTAQPIFGQGPVGAEVGAAVTVIAAMGFVAGLVYTLFTEMWRSHAGGRKIHRAAAKLV